MDTKIAENVSKKREVAVNELEDYIDELIISMDMTWHNQLGEMIDYFPKDRGDWPESYKRLEKLASKKHMLFGGNTWIRFWDVFERDELWGDVCKFYINNLEHLRGIARSGVGLEQDAPVFLIVKVKDEKPKNIYPIIHTVKGHKMPCIFVVIND